MRPSLVPRSWLRLPRRTARMRLTVVYAAMFLVFAVVLLALVNVGSRHTAAVAVSPHGAFTAPVAGRAVRRLLIQPGELVAQQQSADNSHLLAISLFALAITTAGAALLGWIAAGRVLSPLRTITTTAQTISARNLHERLALAGPNDEFKQLGDTLDALLGRLEASFEAQRRFVANASHELRTPLTLERTLLQVTLADPSATAATFRHTCEELLAAGRDQERLLEALLTLASSERGLERREQLDLARVAHHVLEAARPDAERPGVAVQATLDPAPALGDRALIERLAANLIDNALRYNEPGGRVEVVTSGGAGGALLRVENTGPEIAAADVERLFEPFQRLGAERVESGNGDGGGHGLGLSIARAIVSAHGGTIVAEPRDGGGLVVTVALPREG